MKRAKWRQGAIRSRRLDQYRWEKGIYYFDPRFVEPEK